MSDMIAPRGTRARASTVSSSTPSGTSAERTPSKSTYTPTARLRPSFTNGPLLPMTYAAPAPTSNTEAYSAGSSSVLSGVSRKLNPGLALDLSSERATRGPGPVPINPTLIQEEYTQADGPVRRCASAGQSDGRPPAPSHSAVNAHRPNAGTLRMPKPSDDLARSRSLGHRPTARGGIPAILVHDADTKPTAPPPTPWVPLRRSDTSSSVRSRSSSLTARPSQPNECWPTSSEGTMVSTPETKFQGHGVDSSGLTDSSDLSPAFSDRSTLQIRYDSSNAASRIASSEASPVRDMFGQEVIHSSRLFAASSDSDSDLEHTYDKRLQLIPADPERNANAIAAQLQAKGHPLDNDGQHPTAAPRYKESVHEQSARLQKEAKEAERGRSEKEKARHAAEAKQLWGTLSEVRAEKMQLQSVKEALAAEQVQAAKDRKSEHKILKEARRDIKRAEKKQASERMEKEKELRQLEDSVAADVRRRREAIRDAEDKMQERRETIGRQEVRLSARDDKLKGMEARVAARESATATREDSLRQQAAQLKQWDDDLKRRESIYVVKSAELEKFQELLEQRAADVESADRAVKLAQDDVQSRQQTLQRREEAVELRCRQDEADRHARRLRMDAEDERRRMDDEARRVRIQEEDTNRQARIQAEDEARAARQKAEDESRRQHYDEQMQRMADDRARVDQEEEAFARQRALHQADMDEAKVARKKQEVEMDKKEVALLQRDLALTEKTNEAHDLIAKLVGVERGLGNDRIDLVRREGDLAERESDLAERLAAFEYQENGGTPKVKRLRYLIARGLDPMEHLDAFVDEIDLAKTINTLQERIDSGALAKELSAIHVRYLSKLVVQHTLLPEVLRCHGVARTSSDSLAEGGFADVYKGTLEDGSVVAIKAVRGGRTASDTDRHHIRKACWAEAIVWRRLHHKNVLPFLGIDTESCQGTFCLISPWMNNGSLRMFIDKFPQHERMDSMMDIINGLDYIHNMEPPVIHADLRGANVVVGDDHRCRLADFGISKITHTLASFRTGPAGTLRWMSPEAWNPDTSKTSYTPARDIWALACTAMEIYSPQKRPYSRVKSDDAIYGWLANKRPPEWPIEVPPALREILKPCLEINPNKRPSAQELIGKVEALRAKQAIVHSCSCAKR